jgi:hypothetical protein
MTVKHRQIRSRLSTLKFINYNDVKSIKKLATAINSTLQGTRGTFFLTCFKMGSRLGKMLKFGEGGTYGINHS